jgi:hypothetical protein
MCVPIKMDTKILKLKPSSEETATKKTNKNKNKNNNKNIENV